MRAEPLITRIFVYGSLRPTGGAFGRLLAADTVSVVDAELVDHALFGWGLPYPFVAREPGRRVVGSVIEIQPDRIGEVLSAVDEYEGPDYERVEVEADVSGDRVAAFTYVARPHVDLGEDRRIESGDWMMPF